MKIKFPKTKKNFSKENQAIRPSLYWHIILFTAIFLILGAFSFGLYFYLQVSKEFVAGTSGEDPLAQTVKKERINAVLDYFAKKETRRAEIINSPSPVIDPSK